MIKEPRNVDFYTTGRTPSEEEFAHISALIEARKAIIKKQRAKKDLQAGVTGHPVKKAGLPKEFAKK